jgi:hypothetical protein
MHRSKSPTPWRPSHQQAGPRAQVSRLQAVIAEAAALIALKVSWSPPGDGADLDGQFSEMSLAVGRLAEAADTLARERAAMQVRHTIAGIAVGCLATVGPSKWRLAFKSGGA